MMGVVRIAMSVPVPATENAITNVSNNVVTKVCAYNVAALFWMESGGVRNVLFSTGDGIINLLQRIE